MIDEQIRSGTRGLVVCAPEQNGSELDGHLLQEGEWLELRVFGSWIPGQVAKDHTGWYLLPPEGVGIRLRAGNPARLSEGSIAGGWVRAGSSTAALVFARHRLASSLEARDGRKSCLSRKRLRDLLFRAIAASGTMENPAARGTPGPSGS